MIVSKVKIPQSSIIYKYSSKYDILDVYIEKVVSVISDEISTGIYSYFDENTDELVGLSIMDYTRQSKSYLKTILPFDLNFEYIDKSIITG